MDSFFLNGYLWRIVYSFPDDYNLVDRTGKKRPATTDPKTRTIYLSLELHGDLLNRVLIHELGHAVMFSYGLLDRLHFYVRPKYWIEAEEWVCNFIADYGYQIFTIASDILGERAWLVIPHELEKIVI